MTYTATSKQLGLIEAILTANNLHAGHFDRLWKRLEAARIDERAPGDGTPMDRRDASRIIDWLLGHGYRPASRPAGDSAPLPAVPEGHYAVPSTGANDLDFWRVDRPESGGYAGRVFVKRVIGGRPDVNVRNGEARAALEAIAAHGADAAGALYGVTLGQCRKCNRHLTDETSRALGIGPECRQRAA